MSEAVVLTTLAYAELDELFLLVHADLDPSDDDWNRMIAALRPKDVKVRKALVIATNTRIEPRKRRQLAEVVKPLKLRVAVLTNSMVTRAVVSVIELLVGGGYRAFDSASLEAAMTHLDLDSALRERARKVVGDLERRLHVETKTAASAS